MKSLKVFFKGHTIWRFFQAPNGHIHVSYVWSAWWTKNDQYLGQIKDDTLKLTKPPIHYLDALALGSCLANIRDSLREAADNPRNTKLMIFVLNPEFSQFLLDNKVPTNPIMKQMKIGLKGLLGEFGVVKFESGSIALFNRYLKVGTVEKQPEIPE